MRKSALFLVSFCLFITIFSFITVNSSYAVGDGEACTHDEANPCKEPPPQPGVDVNICSTAKTCDSGYKCLDAGDTRRCRKQNALVRNCKCVNENQSGAGNNGFYCDGVTNVVLYCGNSSDACVNSKGAQTYTNTIDAGSRDKYPGDVFSDVRCERPRPIAKCRCIGKGTDGQNNFECTVQDPNTKEILTGTAFCGDSKHKCIDIPREDSTSIYTGPTSNQQGEAFSRFKLGGGLTMRGIDCRQPGTTCKCTNPGRNGTRINGFVCTQVINDEANPLKETDYCQHSNQACIDDPNAKMPHSPHKILAGAPVSGVKCEVAPTVPPPPPPCAAALDKDGKCTAFASGLGTFKTDAGAFVVSLFAVLLSISGGIALLLIIKAGYQIMVAAGKPEQINAGREQLVAAIVGLLFIIFSFVILEVIGVDILRIPGFG